MSEDDWQSQFKEIDYYVVGDFAACIVSTPMGTFNGYLGVPPKHPWHGKHYDEIVIGVHGGLTWAEDHVLNHKELDIWWLGFDCHHITDIAPNDRVLPDTSYSPWNPTFKTEDFVRGQIESMARQAVEVVVMEGERL